jgi:large subunit ribosomal protein L18
MSATGKKSLARLKRKRRIRKKVIGSPARPRLCVFRSARHIYAQVIDDTAGRTLASASSLEPTVKDHERFDSKKALAVFVGKLIGERLRAQGISKVVFDRNGFLYHGRVKAVSDGAREAGLEF